MSDGKLKITRKLDDKYKVFSVRLKKDIVNRLNDIAHQTNRSRNELINVLLEYAIDNIDLETQLYSLLS